MIKTERWVLILVYIQHTRQFWDSDMHMYVHTVFLSFVGCLNGFTAIRSRCKVYIFVCGYFARMLHSHSAFRVHNITSIQWTRNQISATFKPAIVIVCRQLAGREITGYFSNPIRHTSVHVVTGEHVNRHAGFACRIRGVWKSFSDIGNDILYIVLFADFPAIELKAQLCTRYAIDTTSTL